LAFDQGTSETPAPAVTPSALAEALWRSQFVALDFLRRAEGLAWAAAGFSPIELPYRVLATGRHWWLRDYAGSDASPPLLIVAAPIKRPYIWDLAPHVSVVRYCRDHGLHVYLVEWIAPPETKEPIGLDECVQAVAECAATVASQPHGMKPFLIGHSLGGTLAAISGAYDPQSVRGLLLLGAPLCFSPAASRFGDAVVAIMPCNLNDNGAIPGSLLSHASALAAPDTFLWSRWLDAAMSMGDLMALDVHARVERWALDEAPIPGRLLHQIVEELYRENHFCRGALAIRDRIIGPSDLALPTLAVVNTADEVAPLATIEPLLAAMPTEDVAVIKYAGETGVALQHLAILVGRHAFARIWPEILAWLTVH
jgi:polyhydroxyalkanoate synthase subunit PhaC